MRHSILLVELLAVTWVPCILRHYIISRVISSHMGPIYIETLYIISRDISSHMGPMCIKTLYIISRVIRSHMGPMYIETIYIISRVISSHISPMYIETPYIFLHVVPRKYPKAANHCFHLNNHNGKLIFLYPVIKYFDSFFTVSLPISICIMLRLWAVDGIIRKRLE